MKYLIIIFVILISGCTDSDITTPFLNADITGEKYTIYTASGGSYKVNDYTIGDMNRIYFTYNGSEYKSNVWTVKTTKVED